MTPGQDPNWPLLDVPEPAQPTTATAITLEKLKPFDWKRRPRRIEIRGGQTIFKEIKYDD